MGSQQPPVTPDGRYIVVRGRLWRAANPHLATEDRQRLINSLMNARREVRRAKLVKDGDAERTARIAINATKIALGERGPPWWSDGAPDLNRHMARNTCYAKWYEGLTGEATSPK